MASFAPPRLLLRSGALAAPLFVALVALVALVAPACGGSGGAGAGGAQGGAAGQGGTGGATGQGGAAAQGGAAGQGGGAAGGQGGAVVCGAPDDPDNCGTCGNVCAPGQICSMGACACDNPALVSFGADIQPILTASCAKTNCHTGALPDAGLDLTAGAAYAELVGKTAAQCNDGRLLVEPGMPETSYVIDKITNHGVCGGKKKMPPSGTLALSNQMKLSAWICLGALDD